MNRTSSRHALPAALVDGLLALAVAGPTGGGGGQVAGG